MSKGKNIIPEFSSRLKHLIDELKNGNQAKFAKSIHISESSLSQVINEHYGGSVAMIFGIAESYPDVNINWLLTGEGKMYFNKRRQKTGRKG